ncbi:zinc finger, CCHC-type containing protein [Tanacetum coccineum]
MNVKTSFLNGELDEKVYINQPQGFIMPGNEDKVDLKKEFLSSRFFMKDMEEADVILGIRIKHESNGIAISQSHYIEMVLNKFNYFNSTPVSTPMDTSEKLMPNNGSEDEGPSKAPSNLRGRTFKGASELERKVYRLHPLGEYVITLYTNVGKLKGYTNATRINNNKDNSSTRVFLLGGGEISWASKKHTCITISTMKYEFVALAAAGKEFKCAATLVKAYSQMYNRKSRHIGVKCNMIRELITNVVVSIEFVRFQRNLANYLIKGLARHLVLNSDEGMSLKSNLVTQCQDIRVPFEKTWELSSMWKDKRSVN